MRVEKISYVGAVCSGALLILSCQYYFLMLDLAGIKKEITEFQKLTEDLQAQVSSRRQQLQANQQMIAKGSAIGETVGPAVVKDLLAIAEKPTSNSRIKELLSKYGVKVKTNVSDVSAAPPLKKGVN